MAGISPDYKKLYLEQRRLREAAERAGAEEQRKREAAENAQREAEQATRKTTLPEFLVGCHNFLHTKLNAQTDTTLSTQGNPDNAKNKRRPERLLHWEDFPTRQEAIWKDLMKSKFVTKQLFTSVHTMKESGETSRNRVSSEADLQNFLQRTVEQPISIIMDQIYRHRGLKRTFNLKGGVSFENHANTLCNFETTLLQAEMQGLSISPNMPRRSERLQLKVNEGKPPPSSDAVIDPGVAPPPRETPTSLRPYADQFCVYNINPDAPDTGIAAFIGEFKAPHKVQLGRIHEGLTDMILEDVIRVHEVETLRDGSRRLMAAVITQAFSYMISLGTEFGCVFTGEAFIFLRVPVEDCTTVYYFLSVPQVDVEGVAQWSSSPSNQPNQLHLTALGQILAFTLQALKGSPRDQMWRDQAVLKLKTWELEYGMLLDVVLKEKVPPSEYRPPRDNQIFRMTPVQLRPRPAAPDSPTGCKSPDQHDSSSESDDDDNPGQDTPSRAPRVSPQDQSRTQPQVQQTAGSSSSSGRHPRRGDKQEESSYCTQRCLVGLVEGGLLDVACPNVREHGEGSDYHGIDLSTFLSLIQQQLSESLDVDCRPVSMPGACGVLFRIRLSSHGYTVVAKATPSWFVPRLRREAAMYDRMRSIQGLHVPVHLGNIDLRKSYIYDGVVRLVHMMLLSFGGKLIFKYVTAENKDHVEEQVAESARAIHDLGILHEDLKARNILWSEELSRVMIIDFERAQVVKKPRVALGVISPNRKRKRAGEKKMAETVKHIEEESVAFRNETQMAMSEVRRSLN